MLKSAREVRDLLNLHQEVMLRQMGIVVGNRFAAAGGGAPQLVPQLVPKSAPALPPPAVVNEALPPNPLPVHVPLPLPVAAPAPAAAGPTAAAAAPKMPSPVPPAVPPPALPPSGYDDLFLDQRVPLQVPLQTNAHVVPSVQEPWVDIASRPDPVAMPVLSAAPKAFGAAAAARPPAAAAAAAAAAAPVPPAPRAPPMFTIADEHGLYICQFHSSTALLAE